MARNQLKVLHALDVARTQWYHFTAIVIAGMGFFTDAFDLFSISLITDLLGRIYYKDGKLPPQCSAAILSTAFYGAVLGQLVFGWLGDKMGRKRIYGVTLKLMVVCSLASGLSFRRTPASVITTLCFFRFWLGFSIGGDYPLSATIMAEYANKRTRGTFIAAVFAMQGLGNITAGIVGVIVSAAFRHTAAYRRDPRDQADSVWRIILMSGAIPAFLTYYLRMQMPETARYTALVTKNAKQATLDMSAVLRVNIEQEQQAPPLTKRDEFGLFSAEFLNRHGLHLLSTTVCWLVLDVTFYSLNLFMKDIFTDVGWFGDNDLSKISPLEQTFKIASTQALIAVVGTLPGYFFTVALVDRIGRLKIQLLGFTMMTVLMLGLAVPYRHWVDTKNDKAFGTMYAFIFFFANFGPNSTTFIIPAEIFPARMRSTCHGVSGAGGKIGAIVGVFVSLYVAIRTSSDNGWRIQKLLYVLIGCNLVGLVFTLLLPESQRKSLEEITGEIEDEELPEDATVAAATAEDVHTVPL